MGWGEAGPHGGWADAQLTDGSWLGDTDRVHHEPVVAYRAACSCGWRSEREHPVPPRPPFDEDEFGPYQAWIDTCERAENLCSDDWDSEHFDVLQLLDAQPHSHLFLGLNDKGFQRHFLDGRPVEPGTHLELLFADGTWLPIVYGWLLHESHPPIALAQLGVPDDAQLEPPLARFDLSPRAILRWPEERSR